MFRWISSFIFLPDIHLKWSMLVERKINEILKKEKFDLIFITSPPYSLASLAARLTDKINIPVVLDMRDPWTIHPFKIYPSNWHHRKDKSIEKSTISKIKYGVSATHSLIEFYSTPGLILKKNWLILNGLNMDYDTLIGL